MFVKNLYLKNFRNYTEESFDFDSGINILTGANAQGKTNAVEAVFFLCTGYSPRANKDKLVVKQGENVGEISSVANGVYGDVSAKIIFNANDKKRIFVNGLEILKVGELLGNIHSVFFNPSELKLVQESPEDRRRFMNISLSQMSKNYFYALVRYNKILEERNNLLKESSPQLILDTISIWDEQFAKYASVIIKERNEFLSNLAPIAQEKHSLLSNGREILTMKTESDYSGDLSEIEDAVKKELKLSLSKDMKLGYTSIGPHRDDIKFILNGEDARVFGSQGQQRTIALAIKLAETESFFNRFGEYPVLILDDVLSELDRDRQKKLISSVEKMQTLFTTADFYKPVFKGKDYKKFIIENGKIKSVK
ncbi:MAG: DNA replication/repair protein RecF [Clostridia bacterium]|nr:DNA replication/repair protein RecF [Clostridia bacterium]